MLFKFIREYSYVHRTDGSRTKPRKRIQKHYGQKGKLLKSAFYYVWTTLKIMKSIWVIQMHKEISAIKNGTNSFKFLCTEIFAQKMMDTLCPMARN